MSAGPYRDPPRELAAPPREVSRSVRIRLLFGGFLNQFGWAWCAFGLILGGIFLSLTDLSSTWQFAGAVQTVQGTVVRSRATPNRENRERVYAIDYTFKDATGVEQRGTSYDLGFGRATGESVRVEYPQGKPKRSRIEGLRRAPFAPWVALSAIFPLIGVAFVTRGLVVGRRALRLLRGGRVGWGKLVKKRATSVRINNQPVYALTFEFDVDGRPYHATARTHRPEVLEDDRKEQLVYDPADPRRATLVDHLPGAPRVDERGHIGQGGGVWAALALVLPALSLLILLGVLIFNATN